MSSIPRFDRVLVDTGPLVAILLESDQYHGICLETMRTIRPPLITCWPVLTEAAWLLRNYPKALSRLYRSAASGNIRIAPLSEECLLSMDRLSAQFQDLRPQLADLALLHLSKREQTDVIFTLDRRDFSAFQRAAGSSLRLLPESL